VLMVGTSPPPQPIDQVFDTDIIKWVRHFRVRHG
jgi:hypothetical protein